ncbi:XRE family transcriptional regulator [Streptomyces sp. NPDC048106]|uniref:XRE family transcriptional regulator n=1 Tax=Streptomyces sp. NPDC048106 TaxID=3155750 RepID=UPI00345269D3
MNDAMRNTALEAWMSEHGHSSNSLADAVNSAVERLTGRAGGHDGASVRDWKSGRVRWPKAATRKALEDVTGLPATALGFVPRGRTPSVPASSQEDLDIMKRRSLVGGIAAAAAAAATPGTASMRRIGMGDVDRLHRRFAEIVARDHLHGGQLGIEQRAVTLADAAINLQNAGSATQRVRSGLYAAAAAFRSSAMWAAIDGRRYDDAKAHMREAQTLAELSGDQAIKFRIWSHAGSLYRHMGRPAEALAANDVACNLHLTRRDPLFACLGYARQAATLGLTGDTAAVQRALGRSQDAWDRADRSLARPVWMAAVLGGAEFETLAVAAHLRLGDFERAEMHAHRGLALLHPRMLRDRAINTARLATAQLGQGDIEPAVATARRIPSDIAGQHARVAPMLQRFGAMLRAAAPGTAVVRTWDEHVAAWGVGA